MAHIHEIVEQQQNELEIIKGDEAAIYFKNHSLAGWASLRSDYGHGVAHGIIALGGRKDTPAASSSPLGLGAWGVDVVETPDPVAFLESIQWEQLKAGRPADGVFEVLHMPQ